MQAIIIKNSSGFKRGTYYPETQVFRRDNTPTVKLKAGYLLCLEPECIEQLRGLGCREFNWGIREKEERLEIPFEDFATSKVVTMGGRKQHRYFLYK